MKQGNLGGLILAILILVMLAVFLPPDALSGDRPAPPLVLVTNTPHIIAAATPQRVENEFAVLTVQPTVNESQGATEPMEFTMDFALLIALATVANRATEAVKRALIARYPNLSNFVLLFVSLLVGIVIARASQTNWFPSIGGDSYSWVGTALSGILIGAASNFIHTLTDILAAVRDALAGLPTTQAPASGQNARMLATPQAAPKVQRHEG